ncbi:MAG TPA: TolC family protein, partial [Gemmatimonadales bacterium]|nr:TolC family protein [Gemmatimonadales bacterium]
GYQSCLENNQIRTSAGLSPANCLSANGLQDPSSLDPAVVSAFHERNNVFPFSFSRQPFSARLSISLPIFNGFSRELDVSQQQAQHEDAEEAVRANRLLVRKTVEADYLQVQTAYSSIAVQQAARDAARDQLRLAQDRYRLGSGTALELSDAQNAVQSAEGAYVNAVYGYHIAIAALEAAVGRPLR